MAEGRVQRGRAAILAVDVVDYSELVTKSHTVAGETRRCRTPWAALWMVDLAGCSPAPSHAILGAYFPSWMICALAGIGATIVVRQILVAVGMSRFLPIPVVVYLSLATAFAFATWLIWLG